MPGYTTWLIAGIGATAAGLVGWAVVQSYLNFVRSGEAHTGAQKLPLFFALTMSYIKAFSKIMTGYHRYVPKSAAAGATQTIIARKKVFSSALDWIYDFSRRRLLSAGSPHGFSATDFVGFWVFASVTGAGVGLVLSLMTGWWFLLPIFFFLGVLLPQMWLSDLVTRRQTKVKKELPFALDLLTLSVEAGQDFTAAMATIVEKLQNSPLSQEFDQVYKEINMGRQRAEALRDMSGRLNMFEVNNVVSALVQADELGTGLGRVLRIQAEEVRRRRFEAAEKRAQQAPVKMLFPLVVFIFPATMLTIASPLIITFIRALLRGTGFRWF